MTDLSMNTAQKKFVSLQDTELTKQDAGIEMVLENDVLSAKSNEQLGSAHLNVDIPGVMTPLSRDKASDTSQSAQDGAEPVLSYDIEEQHPDCAKNLDKVSPPAENETVCGRRKKILICELLFFALLILATTVGILQAKKNDSNGDPIGLDTGDPKDDGNLNQELNYTMPAGTPANDLLAGYECSSAGELAEGDTVFGSTFGTMARQQDRESTPLCGDIAENGIGLWYFVVGSNQVVTASTCSDNDTDLDTQISIFEGFCDNLSCVAGNDQYEGCGDKSEVSWFGESGKIYFVLVHGYRSSVGDFQLSLRTEVTTNVQCDSASHIEDLVDQLDSRRSFQVFDSSRNLSPEGGSSFITCSNTTQAPGRWYSFTGSYTKFTVSTCSDMTNYDAEISVFSGDGCEGLECVGVTTKPCGKSGRTVEFSGNPSQYYVLVHGTSTSAMGEFQLTIAPSYMVAYDNRAEFTCPGYGRQYSSIPVISFRAQGQDTLSPYAGTTPPESSNPSCTDATTSGVQSTIVGTGSTITLSTCSEATNYDAPISIFAGPTCEDLACVEVTHKECDSFGTTVSFQSTFQTVYYVIVHDGFDGSEKELTVFGEAAINPWLDKCDSGEPLNPDGSLTMGILDIQPSALLPAAFDGACGEVVAGYGARAWYSVTGTGQNMTADTCDSKTNFDTQLSVFSGGCDGLECVGGNDNFCGDKSSVSWQSQENATYFVLIQGFGSRVGVYGLRVHSS